MPAPARPISDVFTPGGTPEVTYVSREHLNLEANIRSALARPNRFTVVSGPTKAGKSVLCEKVLANQPCIVIDGGQIGTAEEFWQHVSWKLNLPNLATKSRSRTFTLSALFEFVFGTPATGQAKAQVSGSHADQTTHAATYTNVMPLAAINEMRRSGKVLIIEDFHYLPQEVQLRVVRTLKSAVKNGIKVLILSVPHRTFDAVEVETEVEGRIDYVRIPEWHLDDLLLIPDEGFKALGYSVPRQIQRRICEDGFGNPNLVQEACYHLATAIAGSEGIDPPSAAVLTAVYDRLVENNGLERFERLFHAAPAGKAIPTVSLTPRPDEEDSATSKSAISPVSLGPKSESRENLNVLILAAVARLGPRPITTMEDIRASLEMIIGQPPPPESEIDEALTEMAKLAGDRGRPPLDWIPARRTLALTDPFLLFYLRWVMRDRREVYLQPSAAQAATQIGTRPVDNHGTSKSE